MLERDLAKKHSAVLAAEADELARKLANWTERSRPRRIVDDATHEKLGVMLAEQVDASRACRRRGEFST
jgi:dsDNA-binding SOS-regulon protein